MVMQWLLKRLADEATLFRGEAVKEREGIVTEKRFFLSIPSSLVSKSE